MWSSVVALLLMVVFLLFSQLTLAKDRIQYHVQNFDGSTIKVFNEQGVVTQSYQYAPFGQQFQLKKPSNLKNPNAFVGGVQDADDLVYLKARHYNPVLGRFYQPDPVTFIMKGHGQTNRYQYGWNDSYSFNDSRGLNSDLNGSSLGDYYNGFGSDQSSLTKYLRDVGPNLSLAISLMNGMTFTTTQNYSSYGFQFVPNSIYSSILSVGVAAIMYSNPTSIKLNQELGGLIYKKYNDEQYFFTPYVSGGGSTVNPYKAYSYNSGWGVIGNYHTHGAYDSRFDNENFSRRSWNEFRLRDLTTDLGSGFGEYRFLGTPSGAIKLYQNGWNYQLNLSTGKREPLQKVN